MRTGRVVSIIIGCLLLLPGLGLFLAGGALGIAHAVMRDDDGYYHETLDRLETTTVAITAEDLDLNTEPGTPDWVFDALDADLRLQATSADSGDIFVGIAAEAALDDYLAGTAHDEVIRLEGTEPEYRTQPGDTLITPPTEQSIWEASASGPGEQELTWEPAEGDWAVVVMNADGTPAVAADVDVGLRAGFVVPLALSLLGLGGLLATISVVLIIAGARGGVDAAPADPVVPDTASLLDGDTPVALNAYLDPGLSRWKWLVKWIMAIPHVIALAVLWVAFTVLTAVAGVAILFTGRYPRGIFEFNLGVLRWGWRVSYYASQGGLGTDRYPPFSLQRESDYPATLDITYPERLSRGLVLVKWWLLAIPHYLILGVLIGSFALGWTEGFTVTASGVLGVLVLVAAIMLAATDKYPPALFSLIIGLNRWVYRVIAYAALMTDAYPPFRLDQGGSEPGGQITPPTPPAPPRHPGTGPSHDAHEVRDEIMLTSAGTATT